MPSFAAVGRADRQIGSGSALKGVASLQILTPLAVVPQPHPTGRRRGAAGEPPCGTKREGRTSRAGEGTWVKGGREEQREAGESRGQKGEGWGGPRPRPSCRHVNSFGWAARQTQRVSAWVKFNGRRAGVITFTVRPSLGPGCSDRFCRNGYLPKQASDWPKP